MALYCERRAPEANQYKPTSEAALASLLAWNGRGHMRCIFCKSDSSTSKSREHIIPESLWNPTQVLPPGIVCDKCNNYFARDVEKPFLELPALQALRFEQAIDSKNGRVPPVKGILEANMSATAIELHRSTDDPQIALDASTDAMRLLLSANTGRIIVPAFHSIPNEPMVSRFLAKVGIEVLAQRSITAEVAVDWLIDDEQFDPLRTFARRGQPRIWPHHSRLIYPPDCCWRDEPDSEVYQIVHEYDFLRTEQDELYFVLALFGVELAINIAGPMIEGYEAWLAAHDHQSPLYPDRAHGP